MKLLRIARSLAVSCLCVSTAACDPGEPAQDSDTWSRLLQVESFAATIVERHSYGGCSYVTTYEVIGDGEECSQGVLHVGLTAPDGELVQGGFDLCGTMTITTDHDEQCYGDDETTTRPLTEFASIQLEADDPEALMTMKWRWADDLVFEAEIDPASELELAGSTVTVHLVDAQTVAEGATREVSVDAEIVLVSDPDAVSYCGLARGRPEGETLRCG
jgi:hypothetical protein